MRTRTTCFLSTMVCAIFVQPVLGGTIPFFDDFEDGNYADGTPVTWHSAGDGQGAGGSREIKDGSLIISGTRYTSFWVDDTLDTTDVSLRAKVRFLEPVGIWTLAARSTYSGSEFYAGGIMADGQLWLGDWKFGTGIIARGEMPTSYEPTQEDISLRMDVFDIDDVVNVSLFAWTDNEVMPTEPQLTYTTSESNTFAEGMVGVVTQIGDPTTVAVRHFEASLDFAVASEQGLMAGDADQDLDFDQMDLVMVQVAGKYLTGEPATWGEGDWDGAPGGVPGNPPEGNGLFDQLDIVLALGSGHYLDGPYAVVRPNAQIPVPEPSSLLLLAAGILAVANRRCRVRMVR